MSILRKPLITEKMELLSKQNVYGLLVDIHVNKIEIRKEIERFYKVIVEKVNTARYTGKPKPRYRNNVIIRGRRASYKKVFVTLKKGDSIDFYNSI